MFVLIYNKHIFSFMVKHYLFRQKKCVDVILVW